MPLPVERSIQNKVAAFRASQREETRLSTPNLLILATLFLKRASCYITRRCGWRLLGQKVTREMIVPMSMRRVITFSVSLAAFFASACFAGSAQAQQNKDQNHSTGGPTRSAPDAVVYFIDVKPGDTLQPKTIIRFGLRNMGVSAAGTDRKNSGHHHLLIDTGLPPLDKPIPNDANHLHFGGGQTEAEVTLAPGEHTLQLLLADKDHIPHTPPVMSEKIRVTVVDPEKGAPAQASGPTPSSPHAKVYFEYPSQGACIAPHSVVRFGLIGMGVAPAGVAKANTGHHHLIIDSELPSLDKPIPNDENHLHFGAGQTEAEVTLPPGHHKLQLLLADERHIPHHPAIFSEPLDVTVGCKAQRQRQRAKYLRASKGTGHHHAAHSS